MQADTYALDATWRLALKDLGISSANVLRRARLPEDLLTQPNIRLGTADFYRFWDSLCVEANDPFFPLRLCQAVRESFSPPLFAALCSPNFLVAIQRIAQYKKLVAAMRLLIQEDEESVILNLIWPKADRPPMTFVVVELLFFVMLARIGTRETIKPLCVTTDEVPSDQTAYADFLGVPIQYGSSHQIIFRKTDALRPFLTTDDSLWAAFEPTLRTRLAELNASVSIQQRVRAVLLEALPSGLVAMEGVAGKLAMSKRTLQRQLEAEKTSYTQLLQQTREALAHHYLKKTPLPVAEIAFLLGFEEPNSFYRAFRQWTGQSPDKVR